MSVWLAVYGWPVVPLTKPGLQAVLFPEDLTGTLSAPCLRHLLQEEVVANTVHTRMTHSRGQGQG